jgi:hypothetical protein
MSIRTDQKAPLGSESVGAKFSFTGKIMGDRRNGLKRAFAVLSVVYSCNIPICYSAQTTAQGSAFDLPGGMALSAGAQSVGDISSSSESSGQLLSPSKGSRRIARVTTPAISGEQNGAVQLQGAPKLRGGVHKFDAAGQSDESDFAGKSGQALLGTGITRTSDLSRPRQWLSDTHPEFNVQEAVRLADQVVFVYGNGEDRVDRVLAKYGIPFKALKWRPRKIPINLDGVKVLILSCDDNAAGLSHFICIETPFPSEVAERIKKWVSDGGYLITTGWETRLLARYLPSYFNPGRDFAALRIKCRIADARIENRDDPLFAGINNRLVSRDRSTLTCSGTHLIEVVDREKDKVLMTSITLPSSPLDDGDGVLAGRFAYGKGQVLHYTAHIHDTHVSEKLVEPQEIMAVNFILEALVKKGNAKQ